MKKLILITAVLVSSTSWACVSLPKEINISNGPAGIGQVEVSTSSITFHKISGANRREASTFLTYSCDLPSEYPNGNGPATGANRANAIDKSCGRIQDGRYSEVSACNEQSFFGTGASIQRSTSGTPQTHTIRIVQGNRRMIISCTPVMPGDSRPGNQVMRIEFQSGNPSVTLGTAEGFRPQMKTRSTLGGAENRSLDFASSTPNQVDLSAAGCGAHGTTGGRTRLQTQPTRQAPSGIDFNSTGEQ